MLQFYNCLDLQHINILPQFFNLLILKIPFNYLLQFWQLEQGTSFNAIHVQFTNDNLIKDRQLLTFLP